MVTRGPGRGATRGALIRAAAGLLEERGMAAVTLRAVGERAGVSRQAPYRHFADKEELLSVVAAGYFHQLGEEMVAGCAGVAGPWARLEVIVDEYVGYSLASPSRHRLMFGPEVKNSPYPRVHEVAGAVHTLFVGVVKENLEAGLLSGDPVEIAALVYAAAHGVVDLTLSGHTEEAKGLGNPRALIRLLLERLRVG